MSKNKVSDIMDDLLDKTTGEVSVGDVVNKFESRGFGPLLLLPALIALLPTGAIPGVPSICGVTLCIICLQMAFGDEHPWLPAVLKNRSLIPIRMKHALSNRDIYKEIFDVEYTIGHRDY